MRSTFFVLKEINLGMGPSSTIGSTRSIRPSSSRDLWSTTEMMAGGESYEEEIERALQRIENQLPNQDLECRSEPGREPPKEGFYDSFAKDDAFTEVSFCHQVDAPITIRLPEAIKIEPEDLNNFRKSDRSIAVKIEPKNYFIDIMSSSKQNSLRKTPFHRTIPLPMPESLSKLEAEQFKEHCKDREIISSKIDQEKLRKIDDIVLEFVKGYLWARSRHK